LGDRHSPECTRKKKNGRAKRGPGASKLGDLGLVEGWRKLGPGDFEREGLPDPIFDLIRLREKRGKAGRVAKKKGVEEATRSIWKERTRT